MASAEVVCMVFPAVMMDLRLGNGHGSRLSGSCGDRLFFPKSHIHSIYYMHVMSRIWIIISLYRCVSENMASMISPIQWSAIFPKLL